MKPCRKQNRPFSAPSQPGAAAHPAPPAADSVRRYAHPIRTVKPPARSSSEEMLSYVLEALSRQSEQLDEVLRRLDGDNSDTM